MRFRLLAVGAAVIVIVIVAVAVAVLAVRRSGDSQHDSEPATTTYEIGLIGDAPYSDVGRQQFPRVIDDINKHELAFTTFDGDIKNGKERCDQPVYDQEVANFGSFRDPLVYVPGDNEWTDCDRASAGSYDANERLALVRRMFASGETSFGQRTLRLTRQSPQYPENVRWTLGQVTYVGLHVPGSDNNAAQFDPSGKKTDGDDVEYTARNAANIAWLDASFAAAKGAQSKAIMIVQQADMWSPTDPVAHYADTRTALARLSVGFGGQVLLVNGDTHILRIDKPLADKAGNVIENFTRVMTFGDNQNHWLSATVNPNDPQVFTFHQHILAANVPTYVSP
jgi:hypothetical protein